MRILLIAGGWSSERDIALLGAREITRALHNLGHEVIAFDPTHDFHRLLTVAATCDFAFINLHGSPGEDGLIQALLDTLPLAYQGAGPASSLLALNKAAAKMLYAANGLATPRWSLLPNTVDRQNQIVPFGFPRVIKPCTAGSSLGIFFAHSPEEYAKALGHSLLAEQDILVEEQVQGQEVTCAVLGDQPLPPVLIKPPKGHFFDYTSKYASQGAEEICPAPIGSSLTATIQEMALQAHTLLGIADYSRTDFIVDDQGCPFALETNTLPGMTNASLLPREARAAGMTFEDLIDKLITLGMRKNA